MEIELGAKFRELIFKVVGIETLVLA